MTSVNETYRQIEQDFDIKFLKKGSNEVCDMNMQDLGILSFITPLNILEKSNENVKKKLRDFQTQHEELKSTKETLIDIVNLSDKGCKDTLEVIINSQISVDEEILNLKKSMNSKVEILNVLQNGISEVKEKIVYDPKIRQELQAIKSFFPIVFEEFNAGNFHGYILNREKHEAEKFLFSETEAVYNVSNNFWRVLGEPSSF